MNIPEEILKAIKQVVMEEAEKLGVGVEKIILFGSRARGDYKEESDYDILIVVEGRIDRRRKIELNTRIGSRLIEILETPVDVVTVSESYWRKYHGVPGTILYPASREGVVIA
ncbi:MAG: nucleotidyltransferase domain-containing protein [Desulfurococcales archaeon]|nr:nucleotidyltransferase domain-containing protein [Desulfurococcales archaeon]